MPQDIAVFGATGFVGRLVAAYLAEHAPAGLEVALAGRSEAKLAQVRAELPPAAAGWPLVAADSADPASLTALAAGSGVIATTVGPYRRSGRALVDACIDAGTDYCDLTGEVLFVADTVERHADAERTGARIVHSTGFDSIPSDLGVFLLHEAVDRDGAGELGQTTLVVRAMRGGFSGGTLASMKGQIDEMRSSRAARRRAGDPYALSPDRAADPKGDDERDTVGVARDPALDEWVGPFVMAPYNTRIVRRSAALLDHAYGRGFRYREVTGVGAAPLGPVKAAALAAGTGGLLAGLAFPPTRLVLDRVLPSPGEGPSEEARRKGLFRMQIHADTTSGAHYVADVAAKGDPGYAATAMMMGQSALCLAVDADRLPRAGGVLTPATAMGAALAERLRSAGMTLAVTPR